MRFRPCIDIHNGKVKQIVGGSLRDAGNAASENFVAECGAADFAALFKARQLSGGHVILLNAFDSPFYEATKAQALSALRAYPDGFFLGGGITPFNGEAFLEAGAKALIVTSYLFTNGRLDDKKLSALVNAYGKEHLVIDLSCRWRKDAWVVVTDRWQTFTDTVVNKALLDALSENCLEFLIHGVDVEGKKSGMDEELVKNLTAWAEIPLTYAGGIATLEDIQKFGELSGGRLDFTVGSALANYGGTLTLEEIENRCTAAAF